MLAEWLKQISRQVEPCMADDPDSEPSIDVRLRYHEDAFSTYTGDSSFDQDHRGFWGDYSVGPDLEIDDAFDIAEDLLDQVIESASQSPEWQDS